SAAPWSASGPWTPRTTPAAAPRASSGSHGPYRGLGPAGVDDGVVGMAALDEAAEQEHFLEGVEAGPAQDRVGRPGLASQVTSDGRGQHRALFIGKGRRYLGGDLLWLVPVQPALSPVETPEHGIENVR